MKTPHLRSQPKKTGEVNIAAEGIKPLLGALRQLIADSRQQLLRAVDVVQVQTFWQVGRHIVEFEQGGAQRAAYGRGLLAQLGLALTAEFGRQFEERNLRNMRAFYSMFPIRNALRSELGWTHPPSLRVTCRDFRPVRANAAHKVST
jgi:hypothetical protein